MNSPSTQDIVHKRRVIELLLIFVTASLLMLFARTKLKLLQQLPMNYEDITNTPQLKANNPISAIYVRSSKHAFFRGKNSLEMLGVPSNPDMNNAQVISNGLMQLFDNKK